MAASANGQFAVDLYRQVAKESAGTNVFLSPYSIATSLTVATEGAVDETRDEMINALRIPRDSFQQIHVGQKELRDSLVPVLPAELLSQITDLRTRLKAANERTVSLGKSVEEGNLDRDPVYKSMREAHELAKEINTLNKTVSTYELRVANSIWMDTSYPYDPQFFSAIESNYGSVLLHADLSRQSEDACQSINQWIDGNTNHQIQTILGPESLDESTRLLIINAVYFKGAWAEPFREESTEVRPFRIADEASVDVSMMHQWNDSTASYAAFTKVGDLFPCPKEVNAE
jgi:serine protease inhibitor